MTQPPDIELCLTCGAAGACAYDAEGRPLTHTDVFDSRDDDPTHIYATEETPC